MFVFASASLNLSKLSPIAHLLLSELKLGTVDSGPNYDGTTEEPLLTPSRLPQLLGSLHACHTLAPSVQSFPLLSSRPH